VVNTYVPQTTQEERLNTNALTRLSLRGLLQAACAMVLLCSVIAWLSVTHWLLELLVHFKVQYFLLGGLFLLCFIWLKDRRFVLLAAVIIALNGWSAVPVLWQHSTDQHRQTEQSLRVFHANVLTSNRQHQQLVDQILAADLDLVVLQEVNQRWLDQLRPLDDRFDYRIAVPRSDNFGMVLFSRHPFNHQQIHQWSLFDLPNIEAELNVDGHPLTILAVHPPPPVSGRFFQARNEHFRQVSQLVNQASTPVVVVGDLNTSQWSDGYRSMVADTGLINASKGRGFLPTWPTKLWPLMIPIDHCLVSRELEIKEVYTGESFGSDHLPLLIELGF
jgi:endonuclease/exonuclease/phosphatase (EEP) superfamily protein YafD